MREIERKFLVLDKSFMNEAKKSEPMIQAYLTKDPERTVRIRVQGKRAYITIKGKSDDKGLSRFEWEKDITIAEAEELLKLALPTTIIKTRYWVPYKGQLFEVDVFEGQHEGLVVAELELNTLDQKIKLPGWCGEEVTGKKEYYNSYLSETGLSK